MVDAARTIEKLRRDLRERFPGTLGTFERTRAAVDYRGGTPSSYPLGCDERPSAGIVRAIGSARGRIAVLTGRLSSGKTALAIAAVAAATAREGGLCAWIERCGSLGRLYPPAAAATGAVLSRLLVVRASDLRGALQAADSVLRSGAFGLALLDAGLEARRIPGPALVRLSGLAGRTEGSLVVLAEGALRGSPLAAAAGLILAVERCGVGRQGQVRLSVRAEKGRGLGRAGRTVAEVELRLEEEEGGDGDGDER